MAASQAHPSADPNSIPVIPTLNHELDRFERFLLSGLQAALTGQIMSGAQPVIQRQQEHLSDSGDDTAYVHDTGVRASTGPRDGRRRWTPHHGASVESVVHENARELSEDSQQVSAFLAAPLALPGPSQPEDALISAQLETGAAAQHGHDLVDEGSDTADDKSKGPGPPANAPTAAGQTHAPPARAQRASLQDFEGAVSEPSSIAASLALWLHIVSCPHAPFAHDSTLAATAPGGNGHGESQGTRGTDAVTACTHVTHGHMPSVADGVADGVAEGLESPATGELRLVLPVSCCSRRICGMAKWLLRRRLLEAGQA